MLAASIFLNGSYPEGQIGFYRQVVETSKGHRFLIAADGGLLLFKRLGFKPELIIGDFDSVDAATLAEFGAVETRRFPNEKDATDGELAIRAAIERGCDDIEIYGAIDMRNETDHLLANLFLLKLAKREMTTRATSASIRIIDHLQRIYMVESGVLALSGKLGDFISVVPISEEIVLSIAGVEWELANQRVAMGSSWTLRNQFAGERVDISVSGTALVVHRHS